MTRYLFLFLSVIIFLTGCSSNNKVEIVGDENSLILGENMLEALGGKKLWAELKSVHVRTTHRSAVSEPYVSEIWANIDENKIITINAYQNHKELKVVNGNDGWEIKDGEMLIMSTNELYAMLRWYKYNFYTNVKRLAVGGKEFELKLNGENRFDIYEKGKYVGGFELHTENFPIRFFSPGIIKGVKENMLNFAKWDVSGSYKFPKLIKGEDASIAFVTELFEASSNKAEKAYKVTFDPVELSKKY